MIIFGYRFVRINSYRYCWLDLRTKIFFEFICLIMNYYSMIIFMLVRNHPYLVIFQHYLLKNHHKETISSK